MFFPRYLPSGARCAGRGGEAAEPVHAGPPGVGNHLIAVSDPCRHSARGEIRDPKPDGASPEPLKGQDCRSRARRGPSEISIPWDPSPGPAGSMGCRRERPQIPKPPGAREPRARKGSVETHVSETQVHGRLAAWAAGGNGREFRSPLEQGSPGRGRVPSRLMSPNPKSVAGRQQPICTDDFSCLLFLACAESARRGLFSAGRNCLR